MCSQRKWYQLHVHRKNYVILYNKVPFQTAIKWITKSNFLGLSLFMLDFANWAAKKTV